MARLVRFVAFFLFIATFDRIFDLGFSTSGLAALTFLWGAEVFKSDLAVYNESIAGTLSSISAKVYLEKN